MYKTIFSEWRRNYGSNRVPIWKPLFTYHQKYRHGKLYRNFDLHYVVPHSTEHGSDDVAFYCSKYLLKPCERENKLQQALKLNLDPADFNSTWSLVKSRFFCSKGFGAYTEFEKRYIGICIDNSCHDKDGLKYFGTDGSTQPLARYYRKFLSPGAAVFSFTARPDFIDGRSISELLRSVENGSRIVEQVSNHDISSFFPIGDES